MGIIVPRLKVLFKEIVVADECDCFIVNCALEVFGKICRKL